MSIYVCSDIHGRYDRYLKLFKYIKDEDTLYILGDVIDRHKGGIKILQDIMKRDNVVLLRGNHEDFMVNSFFVDYEENLLMTKHNDRLYLWLMDNNGGKKTYDEFIKLSEDKQIEIYEFLKKLPLIVNIEVNDNKFYLGHASTINCDKEIAYERDLTFFQSEILLWDSPFDGRNIFPQVEENKYYIHGHVYVQRIRKKYAQKAKRKNEYEYYQKDSTICIDGGCALPREYDEQTRLILLRLDDFKYEYIK